MATSVGDSNLCGEGPLGQALQVVEKKVRNLEKRKVSILLTKTIHYLKQNYIIYFTVDNHKITSWFLYVQGKLDGYRADYQRGKTLNDDQKAAIAKYDEVSNLL